MPSSRPLRKYSSQALTPSPLRRKSLVPQDSDLDEGSDLDIQLLESDGLFGRSTSSVKSLRNHFALNSRPSLNKSNFTTIPQSPVEDVEGLFLSTSASPSPSRPHVPSRPSNPRAKRAPPPPLTNIPPSSAY